tara:strand:- start:977 stop:1159 length:183 start_codon:yes stop_codon:yes gene_type:complete
MKKDFKPHMMYDPKTGKGYKANAYKDHLAMKKKGFVHTKPSTEKRVAKVVQGRSRKYKYG